MPSNLPPSVHLAVSVLIADKKLLIDWNPRWGCFTLPMTKIRQWHNAGGHVDPESETPLSAAIRAAAEALRRPLSQSELPTTPEELELQPYSHRSYRDGKWKRYGRTVFVIRPADPIPAQDLAWVTPDEVETCRPISPTAIEVVRALRAAGIV